MRTSRVKAGAPSAVRARIADDAVVIDLSDGRTVTAPLAWYPRLLHGTARERRHWRLIGGGEGVHWPDLDEISASRAFLRDDHQLRAKYRSKSGWKGAGRALTSGCSRRARPL